MSTQALRQKKIVVIGYGGGGSRFVARCAKEFPGAAVTVVTPFDYQEVSVNMTRVLAVGPSEHEKAIFPLVREPNVEYVLESCAQVQDHVVVTSSGRSIPFDVCVIASGSNIPIFFPSASDATIAERKKTVRSYHEKIAQAKHIVVAGGGPIGVELAADIKLRNKDKRVSLVFSQDTVLDKMSAPYRSNAMTFLQKSGIELYANNRVISDNGSSVTLQSGATLPCDAYFPAHSLGGNSSFLPSTSVDSHKYIKVDDAFKVQGFKSVYAFGDCSNYDPVKVYPKIDDQLPTLLHNVKATLENGAVKLHKRNGTLFGQLHGPAMVVMGHGLPEGYGVGPDLPGCMGCCLWFWCCCGPPCSYPSGSGTAKMKSDFNYELTPKAGKGIDR